MAKRTLPKPHCCLECHFRWEERVLMPRLPAELARELVARHDALEELDCPPALVAEHAAWEEQLFRPYVTSEQWAQLIADHRALG